MKIVVINGSPKGKESNTNVMVESFLKGAMQAEATTENIFLAEKEIKHCKGCHTCWFQTPGHCVQDDDMIKVLSLVGGANIIVFASPVYFENISGLLKVFMDQLTVIGSPHSQNEKKSDEIPKTSKSTGPKLLMLSNCGYSDRSEFDVTSLWINRVAQKMRMPLAGEIYATRGKLLSNPPENIRIQIDEYLKLLELAGKEIATENSLSKNTMNQLNIVNTAFCTTE